MRKKLSKLWPRHTMWWEKPIKNAMISSTSVCRTGPWSKLKVFSGVSCGEGS